MSVKILWIQYPVQNSDLWQIILFNNLEISYGFCLNESAYYYRTHIYLEKKYVLAERVATGENRFISYETTHIARFRIYSRGLFLSAQARF
jgi:hypothetical protein